MMNRAVTVIQEQVQGKRQAGHEPRPG
jgi:hypothetical protein